MKNLFAVLFVLFFTVSVFAQSPIGKGSYSIGGNISYTSETYEDSDDSQNTFLFNPQLGYFFIDNFYTALTLTYGYNSIGDFSYNSYGIGPAVRYYFDAEKLKPFLGASYSYLKFTESNSDDETTHTEFKLTCGADYFVSDGFALEVSLNYSFINYDLPSNLYDNNNSVKKFVIGIGVNYFIF